jgi:hypothetical protein
MEYLRIGEDKNFSNMKNSSDVGQIEISNAVQENWQEILDILCEVAEIPVALIMRLVDPDIEVFVSSRSEGNPYHPGDAEKVWGSGLYCETVIKTRDKLHVPNALADENWKDNPDIKLNMVAYLGFSILFPDGIPFGTLCILDNKPNVFSQKAEKLMIQFRSLIESHLELIYINQILGDKNKRVSDYLAELQALRGIVPICAHCKGIKDEQGAWHPIEYYLVRHPDTQLSHGICPECLKEHYPDFI